MLLREAHSAPTPPAVPVRRGVPTPGRLSRWVALFGVVPDAMVLTWWWLAGVVAGVGALGIVPATAAASTIALRRARGDEGDGWREFWSEWRRALVPANLAVLPLTALAVMAGVNLDAALAGGNAWLAPLAGLVLIVLLAALLWFGPLYAYYQLPRRRHWAAALRLVLFKPVPTLLMVLIAGAVTVGTVKLPVLLVLIAPGALITALTLLAKGAFDHNEAALAQGPDTRGDTLGLPHEPLRIH